MLQTGAREYVGCVDCVAADGHEVGGDGVFVTVGFVRQAGRAAASGVDAQDARVRQYVDIGFLDEAVECVERGELCFHGT